MLRLLSGGQQPTPGVTAATQGHSEVSLALMGTVPLVPAENKELHPGAVYSCKAGASVLTLAGTPEGSPYSGCQALDALSR